MGKLATIMSIICLSVISCTHRVPESTEMPVHKYSYEQLARDYFDQELKKYNPLGYEAKIDTLSTKIDFNKDGILDEIISIVPVDHSTSKMRNVSRSYDSFIIIGIKQDSTFYPAFMDYKTDAYPKSSKEIAIGKDIIISSDAGRSSPGFNKEFVLRYKNKKFVVHSFNQQTSAYPAQGDIQEYVNFKLKEGFRKYQIQDKSFLFSQKIEKEQCSYKILFAQKKHQKSEESLKQFVAESKFITYKPQNWIDKSDLSFSATTVWDEEFVLLSIDVVDDRVILNSGEDIIYGDHIEFWLDFSNEKITKVKYETIPQGSSLNYYFKLRAQPDSTLIQGIVGLNQSSTNSSSVIINGKENASVTLESKHWLTDTGYSVEVKIPLKQLGKEIFNIDLDYRYTNELGFTVVVSDTDDPNTKKQETLMATSTLKHGNPFTLGSLFLVDKFEMPVYQNWSKYGNDVQYQYGFPRR